MITRFLSTATLIASALLSGCALTPLPGVSMQGQGVYVGRHGVISLGAYNGPATTYPGFGNPAFSYNPGLPIGMACPPGSAWDGRGCRIMYRQPYYGQGCRNPQPYVNGRWLCPMAWHEDTAPSGDMFQQEPEYASPVPEEPLLTATR